MSDTPLTDRLIDGQGQDMFYSGTPQNVEQIVREQRAELEAHARKLERALRALHGDCCASDFNEHWESYTEVEKLLKAVK